MTVQGSPELEFLVTVLTPEHDDIRLVVILPLPKVDLKVVRHDEVVEDLPATREVAGQRLVF